ncbi:MAG: SPOR domain-containing protein [Pseudomonadota bacterium]|nr:SPOR domain-containing protein [Pseudomonadota bacterium]
MNGSTCGFSFPKGVFSPSPRVVGATLALFFLVCSSVPAIAGSGRPYLLQVGSFVHEDKAAQEARRLEARGAFVMPVLVDGVNWSRVYVGPYPDKTTARKRGALMKRRGEISGYLLCPQFAGPVTITALAAGKGVSGGAAGLSSPAASAAPRLERTSMAASEAPNPSPVVAVAPAPVNPPSSPVVAVAPAPVNPPSSPVVVATAPDGSGTASPGASPALTGTAAGPQGRNMYLAQTSAPGQEASPPAGVRYGKDVPAESSSPSSLDLHPTIAYGLWYMDMSRKYVNTDYLGKGFLHGPTIGLSFHDLSGTFTFLTSAGAFRGDERRSFGNGQGFLLGERFDRSDFDLTLKYPAFASPSFTLSALLGMQWTHLSSMSADYSLDTGQQYAITGSMDIWGPAVGMEIKAPLGNPASTPVFLFLSGKIMYLRATGNSIYDVPTSGGQYGTSFTGADFSANGWGGGVDAHVTWNVVKGLGLTMGAAIQSAGITDTSPAGNTMRTTNGYYSGYGNLSYAW